MRTLLKGLGLLLALGCGPQPQPAAPDVTKPRLPAQPGVSQLVALSSFSGSAACVDLEQYIEDGMVLELRVATERYRRSALGYWEWTHGDGGPGWGWGSGSMDAGAVAGSGGGSGSGAAPAAYTTTNTQVAGVDEPDIIKNDGTRLFAVSGRRLFTASTWPPTELATRGNVPLDGRPMELFLEGERVLAFSALYDPSFGVPSYCELSDCSGWYTNATLVTHVDVSDLQNPRVVGTQRVPGNYQSARRVGSTVRLVTLSSFRELSAPASYIDWWNASSREELLARFDQYEADSEAVIRGRGLSQWIPTASLSSGGVTTTPPLSCEDLWATNASTRLGLANIVTLSIDDPQAFSRQGLLAEVDSLYQGSESLYLAQRHWWWWDDAREDTYVYRFELRQADGVRFAGAGHLDGYPLNQFSFDEYQGHLRVATTQTDFSTPTRTTVNRVVVLEARDTSLVEVGRLEGLAPGERIMSARFLGDRGYVVTFRAVDPLFVIDLSDPSNPRKAGELKIPGYSTYVHPLDATHLLTIGVLAGWWPQQLQLQMFDVSDMTNPRQTHTQLVGEARGWSEALWDHKAFNFFPAKGLLAIPFSDWYTDASGQWQYVSDLRVYHVDPLSGFEAKGSLEMTDMLRRDDCHGCWSWWWEPQVRRSVMADDYVYGVSSGGIRVANVDSLSQPMATAVFPPAP